MNYYKGCGISSDKNCSNKQLYVYLTCHNVKYTAVCNTPFKGAGWCKLVFPVVATYISRLLSPPC